MPVNEDPERFPLGLIQYHGRKILVYRQKHRRIWRWNADIGSQFLGGDPFDALTPARALAKAKKRIDWERDLHAENDAKHRMMYPDSVGRPPRWPDDG